MLRHWRPLGIGLLAAAAAAVAACRAAPSRGESHATGGGERIAAGYPVTQTDDLGRTVVLTAEPMRIVTLMPSHTEIVYALGAGARLVGVDDFSNAPDEARALTRLGGLYDAHLEQILALRPDIVFLSDSNAALMPLERSGVAVWAGSAKGYDDVFRIMKAIGDLLGRRAEADELCVRTKRELSAVAETVRGRPPVTVYYEVDSTPHAAAPSSFIGRLIAEAGGIDIIPDGIGEFPEISPELVISKNPGVILGLSLDEAAKRPGWHAIDAVRHGRVCELSREETDLVVRPGPRLPEGLRTIARRIHSEP